MGHISQHKQIKPVAVRYPEGEGGREVCADTPAGRREYRKRLEVMWFRQRGLCALCGKYLRLEEATFEHQRSRGMGGGFRDDRIEIDGKPVNAAAHGLCNLEKGSKRTAYLIEPRVDTDRNFEELLPEVC